MKILWASNAPWAATGYGVQTAQVITRLRDAGHQVGVANNFGLVGGTQLWNDIPIFPAGADAYSNDVVGAHARAFQLGAEGDAPTWILTLYDVWVLAKGAYSGFPTASWTPVDHYPVPPAVTAWARDHFTIAMTRFGQKALSEVGVDAMYVPHAFEPASFHPTASDARKALGIPEDAFLVMVNAANKGGSPPRKAWAETLSAFKLFADEHPDAYLYLHTDLDGLAGAPNLTHLMAVLGLRRDAHDNDSRVRVAPQYAYRTGGIDDRTVAGLYSAADVLLAPSMGEGFGVPVIEAQACGTPVIVTDFAASSELVGAGWKTGYQPFWDHLQGSWFAMPLVGSIRNGLEQAYAARGDKALREQAMAFAAQYEADKVFETYWLPVLAAMEEQSRPKSRRERRALAAVR